VGDYDTTSHGGGLAVMANEYDNLTNSTRTRLREPLARQYSGQQRLGNFSHCRRRQYISALHAAPSCESCGSLNGPEPLLRGAAVEGPNGIATKGALSGMIACPRTASTCSLNSMATEPCSRTTCSLISTVEPAVD
jgi:hypothetical protein